MHPSTLSCALLHTPGSQLGGLLQSRCSASLLLAWLVEPGLDPALPVLAEVVVAELVVVLDGHLDE